MKKSMDYENGREFANENEKMDKNQGPDFSRLSSKFEQSRQQGVAFLKVFHSTAPCLNVHFVQLLTHPKILMRGVFFHYFIQHCLICRPSGYRLHCVGGQDTVTLNLVSFWVYCDQKSNNVSL
jgi:hypothetical protein